MRILFQDIPLDKVSTSMTINGPASVLLALYLAVAEEQGAGWHQVSGTIQNDILKEYMARGTYIYPPRPSIRLITNIFEFCAANVPNWNTISISGYHIREAGCTAAQEIAFTLADGIAYVEAALKSGLKLEAFAPRLSFFFNAHNQFFEEIAKFRAARRLWAKIIKERFGSQRSQEPDAALPHPDRRAPPSPPSSPTTTSCAPPCRPWRRCWAAPSPCTPTAGTRRSACPPRPAPGSPCAPSRSSPSSRASPTWWTPSPAAT